LSLSFFFFPPFLDIFLFLFLIFFFWRNIKLTSLFHGVDNQSSRDSNRTRGGMFEIQLVTAEELGKRPGKEET
jgi:hypothetical protein